MNTRFRWADHWTTMPESIAGALPNELEEQVQFRTAQSREIVERLRLAVAGTSDGLWDWDIPTDKIWFAPRFAELLGYEDHELPHELSTFWSHLHPDDDSPTKEALIQHLEDDMPYDVEQRLRTKKGEYRWFRARGAVIRDETGQPIRMAGSIQDIMEQKTIERKLRLSEEQFRQLAENINEVFWMSSANGHESHYVSPAYESIWGRSRGRLCENPLQWAEAIHPDDYDRVMASFLAGVTQGTFDQEFRIIRPDGSQRWIRDRGFPIVGENGQVERIAGIAEDITDKKLTAIELERYAADLERSNKELDDFAYVASHDLKSPLRAIDNLAKWIVEDAAEALPAESREHLDKLQQRVRRMENLLTDLLHYSRAGRLQYPQECVDTGQLVTDITEMVSLPDGFSITIGDDMPVLETARQPLEQVFLNLITNAVKHHDKPHGNILVSGRDIGSGYEFSVADDGPGIDPEFHERVFWMLQTLQPRDKVEGSGMGLSVVKKIVESYRGTIAIDSVSGQGARFRFTWPKETTIETERETEEVSFTG